MNTQINVDETLVNKAAALAYNVSQEDIVIALREFIDRHKPKSDIRKQAWQPGLAHMGM